MDDVPILVYGLWSRGPQRYSGMELCRHVEKLAVHLQAIEDTNEVNVSRDAQRHLEALQAGLLPDAIQLEVLRDGR